jgi:hypothetical protein
VLLRIVGDDLPAPLPLADEEAKADQVVAIIATRHSTAATTQTIRPDISTTCTT